MTPVKYRRYANNTVVHEDSFGEWDNRQPFYDEFSEVELPYGLANIAANFDLEDCVVINFDNLRQDGYSSHIATSLTMRRFQFDHL